MSFSISQPLSQEKQWHQHILLTYHLGFFWRDLMCNSNREQLLLYSVSSSWSRPVVLDSIYVGGGTFNHAAADPHSRRPKLLIYHFNSVFSPLLCVLFEPQHVHPGHISMIIKAAHPQTHCLKDSTGSMTFTPCSRSRPTLFLCFSRWITDISTIYLYACGRVKNSPVEEVTARVPIRSLWYIKIHALTCVGDGIVVWVRCTDMQ